MSKRPRGDGGISFPRMPIKVLENGGHEPTALMLDGRWVQVESLDSFRVTREWLAGKEEVIKPRDHIEN